MNKSSGAIEEIIISLLLRQRTNLILTEEGIRAEVDRFLAENPSIKNALAYRRQIGILWEAYRDWLVRPDNAMSDDVMDAIEDLFDLAGMEDDQ